MASPWTTRAMHSCWVRPISLIIMVMEVFGCWSRGKGMRYRMTKMGPWTRTWMRTHIPCAMYMQWHLMPMSMEVEDQSLKWQTKINLTKDKTCVSCYSLQNTLYFIHFKHHVLLLFFFQCDGTIFGHHNRIFYFNNDSLIFLYGMWVPILYAMKENAKFYLKCLKFLFNNQIF